MELVLGKRYILTLAGKEWMFKYHARLSSNDVSVWRTLRLQAGVA